MNKKTITLILMLLLAVMGVKAEVIPSSYYSAVGEGTYYIYDVTSQKFVGREINRITFEATPTKTFTLASGENEGYTIRYDATTTYMMWNTAGAGQGWGSDFWMDANGVKDEGSGKYASWNFTLTSDNKYKISSSYSYQGESEKTGGVAKFLQGGVWSTDNVESAHEYALIKASTGLIPSSYFSEPAEGTFYLYNVKQGKFLQRLSNNYPGFTDTPVSVTVAATGTDDVYYIKFENSNWLHTGEWSKQWMWTDNTGETDSYKWTFVAIGGRTKTYQLKTSTSHTVSTETGYWYANGTNAWTSANDDCQWALISAANYTAWQNSFTLSDADLYGFSALSDIYNVNPTVNRTMTANVWNTLVVPFDMAIPSGWMVMEPTKFEDGTLTFGTASSIVHGKPYIVKPTSDVTSFSASGVTIYKDLENTSVNDGALTMTGTYTRLDAVPIGSYVIGIKDGNSSLYKVNSAVSLKPFRAYFTVSGNNPGARVAIRFDDDTTGINVLEEENANENTGMKDGKYLENGRIIIVKNGVKYSTNGQIAK